LQILRIFCIIYNRFPSLSCKSKKYFDEEHNPMFNRDFITGINTPEGIASYPFKLEYWDLFDIPEIDRVSKYDNYLQMML